ncbi:MAG: hypothetical protein KC468_03235, partial [Myxococcales bacterium]|nr:hypothetical protein [Myxococcales bacterium]
DVSIGTALSSPAAERRRSSSPTDEVSRDGQQEASAPAELPPVRELAERTKRCSIDTERRRTGALTRRIGSSGWADE